MAHRKKIAWLDTIRVFASFAIIAAHYLMCGGFDVYPWTRKICYDAASLGVFLFFAISGWLIHGSIARAPSLWHFYRRRLIRIVVPFVVAWLFLAAIFLLLGLFDSDIAELSPFRSGATLLTYFISIFPLDINLLIWFKLPVIDFTGEWFMRVILLMYLIAPLLDRWATRFPLRTLAISIAVSLIVFEATQPLYDAHRIAYNWWLFIVRIPEFLFGMTLAIHKERVLQMRRPLELLSAVILGAYVLYFVNFGSQEIFFACHPLAFFVTFPTIFLCFSFAEGLNNLCPKPLAAFNSFSGVSYMAMLLQHQIIYLFERKFDLAQFSELGVILGLIAVTWLTVWLSRRVNKFSDPIERAIAN